MNLQKTIRTIKSRKIELAVLFGFAFQLVFPQFSQVLAAESQKTSVLLPTLVIKSAQDSQKTEVERLETASNSSVSLFPPKREYKILKTYTNIPVTSYTSTIDQTDSTPCITANGFNLCEHNQEDVIAANFLPFGTKVRIPDYYGDQIFTVQDRMNARYYHRADIWMKDRTEAYKWGIRSVTIEVVE